jgi:hypothetical protein
MSCSYKDMKKVNFSVPALLVLAAIALSSCRSVDQTKGPGPDPSPVKPQLVQGAAVVSSLAMLPEGIPEIVTRNDAIVVGVLGSVISQTRIAHPTAVGNPITDPYSPDPTPDTSEPVTDVLFTPDDVLLSDGTITVNVPFTWRVNGHLSDVPLEMLDSVGWPETGRRYLIFLNRNANEPPGDTYSALGGIYDTLLVEGEDSDAQVSYSDGSPVAYAAGMSPSEFVEAVRAEVLLQYPTPGR